MLTQKISVPSPHPNVQTSKHASILSTLNSVISTMVSNGVDQHLTFLDCPCLHTE